MNLSIQDGRAELWQWDTGVRLVMDEACEAINLSEDTFGVTVDVTAAEDGKTWVAAVPDEMLQKPGDLICYAVQSTATGTITAAYRSFRVNRRPKPAGYVATPTEARTWQELNDKKIDAPQVAQAGEVLTVEEVDEDGKPVKWKTQTVEAVKYTAQTLTEEQKTQARSNIGSGTSNFSGSYNDLTNKPNIPAATVIDTTLSQSGQAADAKAAGDAIGKKIDAPQVAQVGQIVSVKSIDESGKVTETEAVDMPNRLDVTVSMGDNGFVVSHKFAEIKAAYDAGRAVQLINIDTSMKYSLMDFFPGNIEGVTYADFRFIDSGGDIWQAGINSNDKIEFAKGSPFVTLYGDVPTDKPKAITYSTSIGTGYADFIPYIEIPSTGDELKERLVIGPAYFYVMPNAYAPFVLKNLVNPYTLTRLSYSEPEFGTENNTFEASYLVTDSLGQQIKATCQVLLTESGLGDLVWNFEVRDSLIVKSSTEGSTKKFKITVDDSGKLTATELA